MCLVLWKPSLVTFLFKNLLGIRWQGQKLHTYVSNSPAKESLFSLKYYIFFYMYIQASSQRYSLSMSVIRYRMSGITFLINAIVSAFLDFWRRSGLGRGSGARAEPHVWGGSGMDGWTDGWAAQVSPNIAQTGSRQSRYPRRLYSQPKPQIKRPKPGNHRVINIEEIKKLTQLIPSRSRN